MYRNEIKNIASTEMVKALIREYHSYIIDEPDPIMKGIFERNIPADELNKKRPGPEQLLEDMLGDFEEYEDCLQELADLSCILDNSTIRFQTKEAYEKYVNYLIVNAPDLLLKAVCLLHWLYNEHRYGHPAPKKAKE